MLGEGKFFNGKEIRSEIGKGNVPNVVKLECLAMPIVSYVAKEFA